MITSAGLITAPLSNSVEAASGAFGGRRGRGARLVPGGMLWLVVVVALVAAVLTPSGRLASSAATALAAQNNYTTRPVGKLVDNIRRQLMHDNYDYLYVESEEKEKTVTKLPSVREGSASRQTTTNAKSNRRINATSSLTPTTSAMYRATYRRVTFKEKEENSSVSIFPMNESTLRYKLHVEADNVQGVTPGRLQEKNKSSESKVNPLINDLLYYIDDKHLRRNNYVSEENNEESLLDSGENNFYTTVSLTTRKRIDRRLYKGYRQRSRMYGVRRKRPNFRVDYKKTIRHRKKHPHFRHKGFKSHRQHNRKPFRKSNIDGDVNIQSNDVLIGDNISEQVMITTYHDSTTETAHTDQNNDQLDQQLNYTNTNYDDYQDDSQNETVVKDVVKEETRPNSKLYNNNAISRGQSDTSSDDQFYIKDTRRSNNEVTDDITEQPKGDHGDRDAAETSVQYKLLKISADRGGRRSGSQALHLLQESGPTGLALRALGPQNLPQFRLPPARRQYMHQPSRLRPPLQEQLPRKHHRHH